MANILLFGGGLQSLSIGRGLKDISHMVYNLADNHAVGKYSRYIDDFAEINLKSIKPQNILNYILDKNIDIVIPTEDESAEWLSLNKNFITDNSKVKVAIVDFDLFSKTINKGTLLGICKDNSIPHPKTMMIDNTNIENIARHLDLPILIKPDVSNGSRGIRMINDYSELKDNFLKIQNEFGTCSAQEYINQPYYYNVMIYRYVDGSFSQHVVTKITRFYPIKGGSSSFCTTIDNDEIVKPCKRLLECLDWVGFADFDVLEKGKGDYRIIEINPRVPASVHAAYISGVNFAEIIVNDLLEKKRVDFKYTTGKQLRFLGLDIAWFLASPNRFKTSPSWFRFIGKNLSYQEGGLKDWKAMAYSIYSGIKKQLSPSFRKAKAGMN